MQITCVLQHVEEFVRPRGVTTRTEKDCNKNEKGLQQEPKGVSTRTERVQKGYCEAAMRPSWGYHEVMRLLWGHHEAIMVLL